MANSTKRRSLDKNTAKVLKHARVVKGWSQSELAAKAKVPRARIKRIECMELSTIAVSEFTALCRALGLLFPKKAALQALRDARDKRAKQGPKIAKKATSPSKKRVSKKAARKILADSGLLDMTLRELLAS